MWRRKEDDLWVVLLRFCKSENARGPKGNKMVEWLFFFSLWLFCCRLLTLYNSGVPEMSLDYIFKRPEMVVGDPVH